MKGDILASGGKSATFHPPQVSQEHFDCIFLSDEDFKKTYGMTKQEYRKVHDN